jgi:hypothetical protein
MQVVRFAPDLDLNGAQLDYAAAEPGLLRYEIDRANVFIPDGGRGVVDPGPVTHCVGGGSRGCGWL